MSGDERQQYQRFVFEKDRDQFLIARALVRTTLSRYANVKPDAWRFQTNEFGKPEIDSSQNSSRLRFNVSHCNGLVLCGVTVGCDIGVDCENVNREVEIESIASRVLSASEREFLDSLTPARRTETFFRFWTIREAYVKARGLGMSMPLQEISFDIAVEPLSISFSPGIPDRPDEWQFFEPTIPLPYVAALAIKMPRDEKINVELHQA